MDDLIHIYSSSEDYQLNYFRNRRSIDWTVEAGRHSETKQEPTNQIRGTDVIIVHPRYNFLSSVNDIALIKVRAPFRLNRYVDKVCLPDKPLLPGEYGFVTGWGFIESKDKKRTI